MSMTVPREYKNPRQFTVRKTVNRRQLLAQRSSTVRVWQDCQSAAITGSKNMYCPPRAGKLWQLDLLADSRLAHERISGVALLRKTV